MNERMRGGTFKGPAQVFTTSVQNCVKNPTINLLIFEFLITGFLFYTYIINCMFCI